MALAAGDQLPLFLPDPERRRAQRSAPLHPMKKPPLNVQFRAQYRADLAHPQTLHDNLNALFQLRERIGGLSPHMKKWLLGGANMDEALQYGAFEDDGPAPAAEAVLRERNKGREKPPLTRTIGLWNGEEGLDGATMGLVYIEANRPSMVNFETSSAGFLAYDHALAACRAMIDIWRPLFVSVGPDFYDPVFKDRPGVGWMLYLPQAITVQQVPEAGALLPVLGDKKRQAGTIIVSVTDAPFSDLNPEHVRIANKIEVRLVDQGLLPRYADF
ncbi:Imm52 family immunity protein [Ralstonia pseudosolanacearum]|uniref:Imm52 family immunity protein n=2 Tax=Ralstonia pseudosolanacearum TaxID=1310165 RepID=UPI0004917CEA